MKRRFFYLSLAATGLAGDARCSVQSELKSEPPQRPNVIFILADDLGWAELGCYGNTFNQTPALDSMARCGVRFTDAADECRVEPGKRALLKNVH